MSLNMSASMPAGRTRRSKRLSKHLAEYYQLYILMLPAIVYIFIFSYVPMYGAQIAFRDFTFSGGIWGSNWVGLKHFIRFVSGDNFWMLFRNTIGINLYSLAAGFPVPIIVAFMLNELRYGKLRKTIQMIIYAPHFMSTVAVCGLVVLFLQRENGLINVIRIAFGATGKDFLADPAWFKTIYVFSGIWQNMGFGTIIYLAALSGVDPQVSEAAVIDGASRLQRIRYIDFPWILPTILIFLILNAGSLLNIGFEKVLLLQNSLNKETSEVISTYVYRLGIQDSQYSYTTAIGLFNSIVNIILLVTVNKITGRLTGSSLW